MATFTLYEYSTTSPQGEPIQPPSKRQTALAFDAPHQLEAATVYFEAIPDVDARVRISDAGTAATSADQRAYADVGFAGHVRQGVEPSIYLTAA